MKPEISAKPYKQVFGKASRVIGLVTSWESCGQAPRREDRGMGKTGENTCIYPARTYSQHQARETESLVVQTRPELPKLSHAHKPPRDIIKAQILSQLGQRGMLRTSIANRLPGRASFNIGYSLCSPTRLCAQKGPEFGLMLYYHFLEILNNFTFELVFCG